MTLGMILYMLIIHYCADFALQTHWQAMNKSSNFKALFMHTAVYSLVWFIASYIYLQDWYKCLLFALLTFVTHTVTDYITSRIAKPFFDKGDYHNGWAVVGMDQIFHYVQLIFTFKLLLEWTK